MQEILEKLADIQASQREMNVTLQNHKEILSKSSKILEQQQEILIKNTIILDEHQKRSTLLESALREEKKKIEKINSKIDKLEGIGLFIKWGGLSIALGVSILKILELLNVL